MEYRYTAIILGKKDIGETDRIYTIFTREEGKVKVKSVGVRKPNAKLAGHLETGMLSAVTIMKRRGMGRITGAICEAVYVHSGVSYLEARLLLYGLSRVNRLVEEGERDRILFSLVVDFLNSISALKEEKRDRAEVVALGFWYHLIRHLGTAPQVGCCSVCGARLVKEKTYSISIEQGGVVCALCANRREYIVTINFESLSALRIFDTNTIISLYKLSLGETHARQLHQVLGLFENRLLQ